MTALTKHRRSEATTHAPQIASWAILFGLLCLSQRFIKFKLRLPSKDCSLVNMQPVLCRKCFFSPTETLNKVIFVITKLPLAQIIVSDSLFRTLNSSFQCVTVSLNQQPPTEDSLVLPLVSSSYIKQIRHIIFLHIFSIVPLNMVTLACVNITIYILYCYITITV